MLNKGYTTSLEVEDLQFEASLLSRLVRFRMLVLNWRLHFMFVAMIPTSTQLCRAYMSRGGFAIRTGKNYHRCLASSKADATDSDPGFVPVSEPTAAVSLLPTRLSASSVTAWKQCPLMWKLKYVDKRFDPPNDALARGTAAHDALEHLFDLPPQERGPDTLHNLFRKHWSELRVKPEYAAIFNGDRDKERAWGLKSLDVLSTYYELEDPAQVPVEAREVWFQAPLAALLSTAQGILPLEPIGTNAAASVVAEQVASLPTALEVVGKIDRLDRDPQTGKVAVVDYKTGKAPFGTGRGNNVQKEAQILDNAVTLS